MLTFEQEHTKIFAELSSRQIVLEADFNEAIFSGLSNLYETDVINTSTDKAELGAQQ